MGGLKDKIPVTHWTMWVGSIAIAGIPGFAGFFSKDEILWQAFSSRLGSMALYTIGLTTAAMTAFYMWRMMNMTFYGQSRVAPEVDVHESPPVMTIPLAVLAGGSVLVGWLGTPKVWNLPGFFRAFETWLEPVFANPLLHPVEHAEHNTTTEWGLMGLSVGIAVAGIALARYLYHLRPEVPDSIAASLAPLHKVLSNKWYVDELYDFLFVNGLGKTGGNLLSAFDRRIVDGGVNGAGVVHALRVGDLDVVGHVGDRWRRARRVVLRQAALVPGVHFADGPCAGVRILRGGGSHCVPGVLHRPLTIWTSTYSPSSYSLRWRRSPCCS